jgi:hypothetical protein
VTVTGNVTSTGNASFAQINSWWTLATPSQLAAPGGAKCGNTSGITDANACRNAIYAAGSIVGSSTAIIDEPFSYSVAMTTNYNQAGKFVYEVGVPGATRFTYTNATGNQNHG